MKASIVAILAVGLLAAGLARADLAQKVRFDIAPQQLQEALIKYSAQAGVQITSPSEIVAGKASAGVTGTLPARDALERLLKGTDLTFEVVNGNTVTIRPLKPAVRDTAVADGPLLRVVDQGTAAEKHEATRMATASDAEAEPEALVVTGSRIRTLLGEQTVQPVISITAEQIARSGVSTLAEVLQQVPQVTGVELGQKIQNGNTLLYTGPVVGTADTRISASLRGAQAGATLLLVDGRRVPKNGQGSSTPGAGEYDLSGIPLAAIERIDILPNGASAIYGADALSGVINVILKKSYTGTEARIGLDNTFHNDATVMTASLMHGFAAHGFSALLAADYERGDELLWRQRPFLKSIDRTFLGGEDLRDPLSRGGTGTLTLLDGPPPGSDTDTFAIPAGSDGVTVTQEDYVNAGAPADPYDYGPDLQAVTPYQRKGVSASLRYDMARMFAPFLDARLSRSESTSRAPSPLQAVSLYLPAGAPGNPFDGDAVLDKYFFDLPIPRRTSVTDNSLYTVGARGEFGSAWRYEASASLARTRAALESNFGDQLDAVRLFLVDTLPVLAYDSTRGPANPPGTIESFTRPVLGAENGDTWTYAVQADGPLLTLPAGELLVAAGVERRNESVDFPVPPGTVSRNEFSRSVDGIYIETRAPLLSARQHIPLIHRLELVLAARRDAYSDFPAATNFNIGGLLGPAPWLMLRGSVNRGYKVPALNQLYRAQQLVLTGASGARDPLRGNTPISGSLGVSRRGNPDLDPEHSRTVAFGAVLEAPSIPGFSFSIDYTDARYRDRPGFLTLAERLQLQPESILRQASNLPGDAPGWAPPIVRYPTAAYIDTPVNIAHSRISALDYAVRYSTTDAGGSDWTFNLGASQTLRYEQRATPVSALSTSSTKSLFPLRLNSQLFWSRGALTTGASVYYEGESKPQRLDPTFVIDSSVRVDLQAGCDIGQLVGSRFKVLEGMRVRLTIFNVMNDRPALSRDLLLPDVNEVLDSRLRRYALALEARF